MKSPILNILNVKVKTANHYVSELGSRIWLHLLMASVILVLIIGIGTEVFYIVFKFLSRQEEFGVLLMNRLLGMVFMVFFSMLIFSNLIITLSTTYISKELDFLIPLPIERKNIFLIKFIESIIYSSWAFILLTIPIFVGYGSSQKVDLWFYPQVFLLVLPFVIIPAGIGAIMTMLIAAYFPAKKIRKISIIFAILGFLLLILLIKFLRAKEMLIYANNLDYTQIMNFLNVGSFPLMPNYWISRGVITAGGNDHKGFIFWLLLLTANAAMICQICLWMIPKYYYRGWALTKESNSGKNISQSKVFDYIDKAISFLPKRIHALISKDIKTFWRDPAQWSQLIILFGLLFIYVSNIRTAAANNNTINLFIPKWKMIISFFNMGATCFVLSILTTRFVYPMLSLEGKQFWIVGLSPIKRSHIIWEKYWLCFGASFIIANFLMALSAFILNLEPQMRILSYITTTLLSFGLTSLSVGLGAMMPNFKEDNPARIANGIGGTLNVVLSLTYIGLTITLEILMVNFGKGYILFGQINRTAAIAIGFILLNIITIYLPIKLGIRHWNKIEF